MPGKVSDPNVDIWFTDRSGINNRFGVGIYGPRDDHRANIPMVSLSIVFLAAVMAILRYRGYLGIKEYHEMKKLTNWPSKGLTESHLIKLMAFPLL